MRERERKLVLGSGSPRRRDLLGRLGVSFSILVADVDEDVITEPDPGENVRQRALLKAEALWSLVDAEAYVLTADTTVAVDGEMLNKPANGAIARQMLGRLCGRAHQVYTGVALSHPDFGLLESLVCVTTVHMRSYTAEEVDKYIATGDPFDKAGSYAIQHTLFQPVDRFEGCYSGVVGLPVCHVGAMLRRAGFLLDTDITDKLWLLPESICACPRGTL